MSAPNNNRASLLAGLRTGGVRSTSGPQMPHTAAPGGSFQIPRFASSTHPGYDDEEAEDLGDMMGHHNFNLGPPRRQSMPMTAGPLDSSAPRFQQQQLAQQQMMLRQAAAQRASLGGGGAQQPFAGMDLQAQAQMQIQMQQMQMQMQMMAFQQQQQYLAAQQQQAPVRSSLAAPRRMEQPSTAGPLQTSFDIRSNVSQSRLRPQGMDNLKLGSEEPGPVPMSAALGGKFGSRSMPLSLNPNANVFVGRNTMDNDDAYSRVPSNTPSTPVYGSTTVISGGTSLGAMSGAPSTPQPVVQVTQSKSDSAISWRRGGATTGLAVKPLPPRVTPPVVTVSKPTTNSDEGSPPLGTESLPGKFRPQPLRFSAPAPNGEVTIDRPSSSDDHSNGRDSPGSVPSSPESNGSAREEASKKLYEGLGMGRPVPIPVATPVQQTYSGSPPGSLPNNRLPSYPVRQPRGPPSAAEDLGQKNFASRLRRKAVGGLAALIGARERRDVVEIAAF